MLDGTALTASHNIQLHLPHALLIVLTVLFLLLGGLTGPRTGFWWLSIKYSVGSSEMGYKVGGLGACVDGSE